jgi:hypothetical protein
MLAIKSLRELHSHTSYSEYVDRLCWNFIYEIYICYMNINKVHVLFNSINFRCHWMKFYMYLLLYRHYPRRSRSSVSLKGLKRVLSVFRSLLAECWSDVRLHDVWHTVIVMQSVPDCKKVIVTTDSTMTQYFRSMYSQLHCLQSGLSLLTESSIISWIYSENEV